MKKIICLLMLVIMIGTTANAHEKCEVQLKERKGIFYRYCPKGTVVVANGTRVSHVGNSIFVDDQLLCADLEVVCDKPAVNVDIEQELD
jgi:hypothetical protein